LARMQLHRAPRRRTTTWRATHFHRPYSSARRRLDSCGLDALRPLESPSPRQQRIAWGHHGRRLHAFPCGSPVSPAPALPLLTRGAGADFRPDVRRADRGGKTLCPGSFDRASAVSDHDQIQGFRLEPRDQMRRQADHHEECRGRRAALVVLCPTCAGPESGSRRVNSVQTRG
jgi:hypothetical protein